MKLPSNFIGRIFVVVVATIVLYAVLGFVTGWGNFREQLASFPISYLLPLVFLSFLNYSLRFGRWQIYLQTLRIQLPRYDSAVLFFATFVMVITPGKLGEAFKAGILWERYRVPLATGVPIILAERLYDFLALFILATAGLLFWSGPVTSLKAVFLVAALLLPSLLVLRSHRIRQWLLQRASRTPYLQRYRIGLEDSLTSLAQLLRGKVAIQSLVLSLTAWAAECYSLWLVCRASAATIPVLDSFFIYAAGTLVGSLTFLPGGLGGTEFTLIGLLKLEGIATDTAISITLIVRAVTLWLAVGIGLLVFATHRKMFWDSPRDLDSHEGDD